MKKLIFLNELKGIGERIEEAMLAKGLNQTQLAAKLGISRSAISQFVHEKRCPSRKILVKMANTLSVSVDFLTGRSARPDYGKLLGNENIRTLVAKFCRLTVNDQERILDILDLLDRTPVKKTASKTNRETQEKLRVIN